MDPHNNTALDAEELITLLAVVSEVLEIEFSFAGWILADLSFHGLDNQTLDLRLSG